VSPRYDLPNAAPEPLRQVQLFVNTMNAESGDDWLAGWLEEHGVASELARARELRGALRALVTANNGFPAPPEAFVVVNRAASRLSLRVDAQRAVNIDGQDALDDVVAVAMRAMLDGSWTRLKACRNCHWSFYDKSPNRSGTWCSMKLCGNRSKTRAYRQRRTTA
jgi:predicted RNA-binding Zn ribbon-like protein